MILSTVIELGCHYQNTVLDLKESNNAEIYMVDAVSNFLDLLPNKNNIHKINAAITANYTGKSKLRLITTETQIKNNLPIWSTTMGSLLKSHPTISKFNWDNLTTEIEVECYSVSDFWDKFKLPKKIDLLITDLEGLDFFILNEIFRLGIEFEILKFESKLMNNIQLNEIKQILQNKNYNVVSGSKLDYLNNPFNHYAYKDIVPNFELT